MDVVYMFNAKKSPVPLMELFSSSVNSGSLHKVKSVFTEMSSFCSLNCYNFVIVKSSILYLSFHAFRNASQKRRRSRRSQIKISQGIRERNKPEEHTGVKHIQPRAFICVEPTEQAKQRVIPGKNKIQQTYLVFL